MNNSYRTESIVLGILLFLGLATLGYFISKAAYQVKSADRVVTVKGLAEKEVKADIAIWPISFKETGNDLLTLNSAIENKSRIIVEFLKKRGFEETDITVAPPQLKDLDADQYYNQKTNRFRYIAKSTITVYSKNVDLVRQSISNLDALIKQGIALSSDYEDQSQYLYTNLNEIKPEMIEQATKNARKSAEKFAEDSGSNLGKIKRAWQGQFSISNRDSNTPYIKKVRVVSTLEYFLVD